MCDEFPDIKQHVGLIAIECIHIAHQIDLMVIKCKPLPHSMNELMGDVPWKKKKKTYGASKLCNGGVMTRFQTACMVDDGKELVMVRWSGISVYPP